MLAYRTDGCGDVNVQFSGGLHLGNSKEITAVIGLKKPPQACNFTFKINN
jgi:hypothetical protein